MNNDDATLLSAYLDDELSSEQRIEVEKRLAEDKAFAALFNDFDALDKAIEDNFSAIDNKPVPAGIEALLSSSEPANVTTIETARPKSFVRRLLPMAAAVATVAILLPITMTNVDDLSSQVANALNTVPSGEEVMLSDNAVMTIQMSFENNASQLCREYILLEDKASTSGQQIISCKANDTWEQVILADVTINQTNNFQPASGQHNQAIEQWLDSNMASDAYTLTQEQAILND